MENNYKVIALIGKAGAGKDFLLQKVLAAHPEYHEIISHTTRPPREGEVNGKNYYFVTEEEFAATPMLEEVTFRDWHYGTSLSAFDPTAINIGVFNPDGLRKLAQYENITLYPFYVHASDRLRLQRQLNREGCPDVEEIVRRFQADVADFGSSKDELDNFREEFGGEIIFNSGETYWQLQQAIGLIEKIVQ